MPRPETEVAKGAVELVGREDLHLRNYGYLHCIVIRDRGTFKLGKQVRVQERTIWLAPQLGIVQEKMTVKKETGEVTIETVAHLKRHEAGQ